MKQFKRKNTLFWLWLTVNNGFHPFTSLPLLCAVNKNIKKVVYLLQLKFLRRHCGRNNFKRCSCILLKCVLHVENNQFSDKFKNGWKISKWLIYRNFVHFRSLILPCSCRRNLTSQGYRVSCSNLFCMLIITSSWKKSLMGKKTPLKWPIYRDLSHFMSLILPWGCDNLKGCQFFQLKFGMHASSQTSSRMAGKK